jgi:hypothetical protein
VWNNSAPTGGIFVKFDIWGILGNLPGKFKFNDNLTRITGTLHEEMCVLMVISLSFLIIMRNFPDNVAEKIKTHISCSVTFFFLFSKYSDTSANE